LDNVPSYAIDYTDVSATAKLLAQLEVQIVISAIQVTDEISSAAEVNLIKSSEKSSTVARFISSGWGSLSSKA
jgi:hypothetical protein